MATPLKLGLTGALGGVDWKPTIAVTCTPTWTFARIHKTRTRKDPRGEGYQRAVDLHRRLNDVFDVVEVETAERSSARCEGVAGLAEVLVWFIP